MLSSLISGHGFRRNSVLMMTTPESRRGTLRLKDAE